MRIYAHLCASMRIYDHLCASMRIYSHLCAFMRIYAHLAMCTCAHVHCALCTCAHVHMCTCAHEKLWKFHHVRKSAPRGPIWTKIIAFCMFFREESEFRSFGPK